MNANKNKSGIYLNDQNIKKCHHCQSKKAPFTILSLVDKETNTWAYPRDVINENNQYTLETFCQTCILYFNKKNHLYEKRKKEKAINIIDHYEALEGIKNINENEPYKYMGIYFNPKLDINVNRNNIHSKTIEKVKTLFSSELSGWNLASAFETLIVGYLRYYWFIDFSLKDISALRKTIKDVMRQSGIVNILMSNDFLYLPRSLGGRGYIDIKKEFMITKILNMIKFHSDIKYSKFLDSDYESYQDRSKNKKATIPLPIHRYESVVYYASKLGLKKLEFNKDGKWKLIIKDKQIYTDNESIKDLSSIIRKFVNDNLYQKLKNEEVGIAKKRIWRENHNDWIHWINGWRHIPKHVEATIWNATLSLMKNRMSLVHQDATFTGDRRCRLCSTAEESIEHLVSGCTTMYKSGVIPRHDSIVKEIVKTLIHRYQIPNITNLLEPEIKYTQTDTNGKITIKVKINVDMNFKNSTSTNNKPDIVVFDYVAKLIRVIDVCVPYDRNIIKRQWEKIDKYSYFINYFKNQYKDENDKSFDVQIVPIITGAFGSIISSNTTHTINNVTHPIRTLKECVYQLPLSITERERLIKKVPRLAITGTSLLLNAWSQHHSISKTNNNN
ncbi:hypothetical protein ACTFIZ_005225 [Dictyostelium cf. discoideum]